MADAKYVIMKNKVEDNVIDTRQDKQNKTNDDVNESDSGNDGIDRSSNAINASL